MTSRPPLLTARIDKLRELQRRLTELVETGGLGVAFTRDEIEALAEVVGVAIAVSEEQWIDVDPTEAS